jgi:hypothetical protein
MIDKKKIIRYRTLVINRRKMRIILLTSSYFFRRFLQVAYSIVLFLFGI